LHLAADDLVGPLVGDVEVTQLVGELVGVAPGGGDYDLSPHFTPAYRPWQQRIAFVPNGDLFEGIKSGKASVVTDTIDRFVPEGIRLASGDVLEADSIITATGFGATIVVPRLREEDADMGLLPWVDPEDFNPGYLMRSLHLMPKQGTKEPWRFTQDYWTEKDEFPAADLDDGAILYR
jgi:cation diffusion facilitator CzcD-associated flavoprotein CzcO